MRQTETSLDSLTMCGILLSEVFPRQNVVLTRTKFEYNLLFKFSFSSAEDSSVQKQLLIRDKFRSNTRKISRIVAEKGLESL